jgi:hypothetical protein
MKARIWINPPHTPSTVVDDILQDAAIDGYEIFTTDGDKAINFPDHTPEEFAAALFALGLAGLL